MTQDEMEQMLTALGGFAQQQQQMNEQFTAFAAEQQRINTQFLAFATQQTQLNERVTGAIERLEITLQAIKDMLERGNGH